MPRTVTRLVAVLLPLTLLLAACGDSDDDAGGDTGSSSETTAAPKAIDYAALGLWDDGPCDPPSG